MTIMNLRNILHITLLGLMTFWSTEGWGQCGTGLQITNPNLNTVPVIAAGTNPCGVSDCAEVCPNDLTTYVLSVNGAGGGASYSWSFGSGVNLVGGSAATDAVVTVTFSNSSGVRAIVTDGGCLDTFYVEIITSLQAPVVSVSNGGSNISTVSACLGDIVNLEANCLSTCIGISYQWFNGNDSLISSIDSLAYPVVIDETILLVGSDANVCISRMPVAVTVRTTPIITNVAINNTSLCAGDPAVSLEATATLSNLSAIVSQGGTLIYSWELIDDFTGLTVESSVSNSIFWQPLGISTLQGDYHIELTVFADFGNGNICESALASSASVTIHPPVYAEVRINGNPSNHTSSTPLGGICENSSFLIQTVPADPFYVYEWTRTQNSVSTTLPQTSDTFTVLGNTLSSGLHFYSVSVTDNITGCGQVDNIQLEVKSKPTFTIPAVIINPFIVCKDQDVVFTPNSVSSSVSVTNYSWQVYDDSGNPWVQPPSSCFYPCGGPVLCHPLSCMFLGGCFSSCPPNPPITNSTCLASNCASFQTSGWYANGSITVSAQGVNGCISDINTIDVEVQTPPVLGLIKTPGGSVCSGTSVTVEINPIDLPLPAGVQVVSWELDGDSISGSGTSRTVQPINNTGTARDVPVRLYYSQGACTTYVQILINTYPKVSVNLPPVSLQCSGIPITVTPSASGSGALTYAWTTIGAGLAGNASGSTWTSTTSTATGSLTVVVTDANVCSATDVTTVPIDLLCTNPDMNLSSIVVCEGEQLEARIINHNTSTFGTFTYTCNSSTDGAISKREQVYSWSTGQTTRGTTNFITIPITALTPSVFTVRCEVGYQEEKRTWNTTTSTCPAVNDPVLYTHIIEKTVSVRRPVVTVKDSIKTCSGQPIDLEASCTGCTSYANYTWALQTASPSFSNVVGSASSSTGPTYPTTVTIANTTTNSRTYVVTVTDEYNCSDVATLPVSINSNPGLFATTVGSTTPADYANYCPTSSVGIIGQTQAPCSGCSYSWSTGQNTQAITVNQPGTYTVTLQQDDCVLSESIVVSPYPQPHPQIANSNNVLVSSLDPPSLFLCGTPDTLRVTSCGGCSVSWNTGATTPNIIVSSQGGYYVQAIDTNGCVGYSDPVLVILSLEGQGSVATADPTQICNGRPVDLEVTPCVGCTYNWYNNTNPNTSIADTRITSTINPSSYFARVTNANGCRYSSNIVTISTTTIVPPTITSNTTILCSGSVATLTAATLPSFTAYQWYRNNSIISGATNPTYQTTLAGIYYCEVTFGNGCVEKSNNIILSSGLFNPEATATNAVVCQGELVDISTPTNPGWLYQWYRDGVLLTGATAATYAAPEPGSYYALVTTNYGCTNLTNTIALGTSTINNINGSTNTPNICPGETAILSVTLCPSCSYQWFDAITGNAIDPISSPSNFNYQATNSGLYYAQVNNGFCFTNSDTIQVTELPVIPPPINSTAGFVCSGIYPTIYTQGCVGCNYTWLRDTAQIFGAQNDTFFTVTNAIDTGLYQVVVTYSNGCRDTSTSLLVGDGTYNVIIEKDLSSGDSLVCNSSSVVLRVEAVSAAGIDCSLGCTYSWIRNGVPIVPSNASTFTINQGGLYTLVITDSRGCQEESQILTIDEVNFSPTLSSNPNVICGVQPVVLTVSSCTGCTYEWYEAADTIPNVGNNVTSIPTDSIGIYYVDVTQSGCTERTPLVSINQAAALNIPIAATDSNICAGDTVTLFRVGGGCTNCTFQWLLDNVPIVAATTPVYIASTPGLYSLQMEILGSNCKDTSIIDTLLGIQPPAGFALDLATAGMAVLPATSGTFVDLDDAISPSYLGALDLGYFYSQPFNAALDPNSGMYVNPRYNFFSSDTSGGGFHRIFYRYDTANCVFVATDILLVLEEPNITIVNENISAPSYEACVSDTLVINVASLSFKIDSVYLRDPDNIYQLIPIVTDSQSSVNYAGTTVWNGYIRIGIPSWAQSSFMLVTSAGNVDTFITPFILVHNENLAISGLPGVVCSNGAAIPLTGTPSGGFFTAQYLGANTVHSQTGAVGSSTVAYNTNVAGAFTGWNFNPGAMTRTSYGPTIGATADQLQNVKVTYNYINTYTNGITCPLTTIDTVWVEARAVFLDSVKYNKIAVSQDRELLSNLVYRVYPYTAQPSQWEQFGRSIGFSGNYVFPAGAPIDFLPVNAGLGKHPMTYIINNGTCSNSKTDTIEVILAPNPIGIPDSMCRTQTFANFGRQLGLYQYYDGPNIPIQAGVFFSDTINRLVVTSTTGPNAGLTVVGSAINLESYNYSPLAVPSNYDTLKVEYWYRKVEYVGGLPVDTIQYIVGSIITPIFIEDTFAVDIIDSIVQNIYCEEDQLYLLAGSPNGGVFTLLGGSAAYASGDTLENNILNPYSVHSPENTNTTYTLTYIKQGAICQNSDSKSITIPEPLDPTFYTQSGKIVYCQTDPVDNILINTVGSFTGSWLINGITQPSYVFNPIVLNPGPQVVSHLVTDNIYGCFYSDVDTFRINPLPVVNVNPLLSPEYCTNDPRDTIQVSPNPICGAFVSGGYPILVEGFDGASFPPPSWFSANTGTGNPWVRTTSLPFGGVGAAFVNTSNDVEDAWLFTPPLTLTTGHVYRISAFMAAGNCASGPCPPAQIGVRVGDGQTIANHLGATATLVGDTSFSHTYYNPYAFTYTHTGLSGTYFFSFQNHTGINGVALTMDSVKVIDQSVSGCVLGGTGTVVGPGISYMADSSYIFNPQVVTPGNYNIRYIYTVALTGCTDSVQMPILVKPHPLPTFTNLAPQYCDNAPPVPLVGNPSGGSYSSTGPNLFNSPFWMFDPWTASSNEIVSYTYTDPNTLCTTTVSDTVTVNAIVDSAIIASIDPTGYCVNEDSTILWAQAVFGTPGNGVFSGAGVRFGSQGTGIATFYPDTAVIDAGRYGNYTLTYIYQTSNGCVDTTRTIARVHAMPDLSFATLPDSFCLNNGTIQVRVNNRVITGELGEIQFDTLLPVGPPFLGGGLYTPYLGAIDTLNPYNFGPGWHNIAYTYTDSNGCTSAIADSFRIDTIPIIYFAGLQTDRIYCENDIPSLLLAYPPYYPGSGFLQITSGLDTILVDSSFYMIHPAVLVDTNSFTRLYDVYYEFMDLNFCRASGTEAFEVRPYPRITIGLPPTFCSDTILFNLMPFVTPQGGIFTDNLLITGIAQDTMLNLASTTGPRRVYYYYTDTVSTCSNSAFQDITVFNTPDVDFYALGGCVDQVITFISDSSTNNMTPGLDSITQVEWIYGDGFNNFATLTSSIQIPIDTHTYFTEGVYQVQMVVGNQGQCFDTTTNQLVISPYITYINNTPYVETFQGGSGGWYQEEEIIVADSLAVWQHASLTGSTINDPGNMAWVTKPNAPYTYEQDERAWVYSPCFDFTNSWRPMIVMNIWRDFLLDIDGSVLEYYDNSTNEWYPLGAKDWGVNWYQTDFLIARPGNQDDVTYPRGWTGESYDWENTRYRLDFLAGSPHVRFRVAFAADSNTVLEGHEGMAFDSVWIGERGRNVLVEHFSNYYYVNSTNSWIMDQIDQYVYDGIYNNYNGRDVSLIQYQTQMPQQDPINAQNWEDPDSRVLYYGIDASGQMRIDGDTRGNGLSYQLSQWDLDYDMMEFPTFDIQITPLVFSGNTIQMTVSAAALTNLDSSEYSMTLAITEDNLVNARNFSTKSVLRKLVPDATGFRYNRPWSTGQNVVQSASWVYPHGTLNPANIELVVYIQDNETKRVLQSATTRDLTIYQPTGSTITVEEAELVREDLDGMNLFPNPATNYFHVSFKNPLNDEYDWRLIDVLGRVVKQGKTAQGTEQMTIETDRLSEGTYFFTIHNDKAYAQRQVVIVKTP